MLKSNLVKLNDLYKLHQSLKFVKFVIKHFDYLILEDLVLSIRNRKNNYPLFYLYYLTVHPVKPYDTLHLKKLIIYEDLINIKGHN